MGEIGRNREKYKKNIKETLNNKVIIKCYFAGIFKEKTNYRYF